MFLFYVDHSKGHNIFLKNFYSIIVYQGKLFLIVVPNLCCFFLLIKDLNIKKCLSTAFHLQSDGKIENKLNIIILLKMLNVKLSR